MRWAATWQANGFSIVSAAANSTLEQCDFRGPTQTERPKSKSYPQMVRA